MGMATVPAAPPPHSARFGGPGLGRARTSALIGLAMALAPMAGRAGEAPPKAERTPPIYKIGFSTGFPDARATFQEALGILKAESYHGDYLTDDVMYLAALKGVLRQLSPPNNPDFLDIYPPDVDQAQTSRIMGTSGSIGVELIMDPATSQAVISEVVEGGPAARAGLRPRDRLLAVDGAPVAGKSLAEAEAMLEKTAGQKLAVRVRRGARTIEVSMACEEVKKPYVKGVVVAGAGVIRVKYFSKDAFEDFTRQLAALKERKVRGLVLDLRGNSGGVADAALKIAEYLLPTDSVVYYTVGRAGRPVKYLSGPSGDSKLPLVVLADGGTASSAELLTAALKDNGRAKVVGSRTKGVGSMEKRVRLANGFYMRVLTDALYRPNREPWLQHGIAPDQEVALAAAALQDAYMEEDPARRLRKDAQLSAALKLAR